MSRARLQIGVLAASSAVFGLIALGAVVAERALA